MKTIVLLCVLVGAVLARPEEQYDTRYDNFDAQELVQNVRLLKNYGKCFLDQGPCTPEGSDFKKIIPDAVQTKCGKCSRKQRQLIRIVIQGFEDKVPDIWHQLVKKEDPNGEYKDAFNAFLKSDD